ncbi:MAG TPA: nucleoside monophosphate kinase [Actinomycetes bacterium]|nr:nucleoside monophosphate kinase [Actinomycetes bacterium]
MAGTTGSRRMILLGAPGSGKGTVGRALSAWLGIPHVSSGQLLRASIERGDPHGIAEPVAQGRFVDDLVVIRVVQEHLGDAFILDGYPRTVQQARQLDAVLLRSGRPVQLVLELAVGDETVVARLTRRASLEGRPDDADPRAIAARLATYHQEAGALRAHYADRLRTVDAAGPPEEVAARARRAVSAAPPRPAVR